ncbi:synthetase CbsF domain protein [Burkholderia sp. ABCPW 111]|nr:synthetase CbsF domain protein [Burkholderia sp. ABCPW 111]
MPGGVEVPDDLPAAMIGEGGPGAIEGQVVDGGQIVQRRRPIGEIAFARRRIIVAGGGRAGRCRRRQARAVERAVERERQRGQHDDRVGRELGGQGRTCVTQQVGRRQDRARARRDVSDALVTGVARGAPKDRDCVAYAVLRRQPGFDVPRAGPGTVAARRRVGASEIFDDAVGAPAREVAGIARPAALVDVGMFADVGANGVDVRRVRIPPRRCGRARIADVHAPGDPGRHGPLARIQYLQRDAVRRTAEHARFVARRLRRRAKRPRGDGTGERVRVMERDDAQVRIFVEPWRDTARTRRLAFQEYVPHARQFPMPLGVDECVEEARRDVQHGDAARGDLAEHGVGIEARVAEMHLRADQQRRQDVLLRGRRIEARRHEEAVRCVERERPGVPARDVAQVAMSRDDGVRNAA